MFSQKSLPLSQEARRNNDLLQPSHKPLRHHPPFLLYHRSCLLDHRVPYSLLRQQMGDLDHPLRPPNPTNKLQGLKEALLYPLSRQTWNVLRAGMAHPPCNNHHQPSYYKIAACLDTIARHHCLRSRNINTSRNPRKASLTLPTLLTSLSRALLCRPSIKLALRPCRFLPLIPVGCRACLRKTNNNTLALHHCSRRGSRDRRTLFHLCHSKSLRHHPI